jgi:putative ABC transport system permease protein
VTGGSLRVALRLGAGAAGRGRWRSLLVTVLIALPVLAMTGAATVLQTVTPTPERSATARMGTADLLAIPNAADDTQDGLLQLLPAGSTIEAVAETTDGLVVGGALYGVQVRALDVDGLARGMLSLLSGRAPVKPDEVAVSPGTAALAGVAVGDTVTFRDLGTVRVVGTVENPLDLRMRGVLSDPSLAESIRGPGGLSWLVDLPPGVSTANLPRSIAVDGLDLGGGDQPSSFSAVSRASASLPSDSQTASVFVLGGLALIEAALVASAAFAVSIRRRQRELGLLGAVGGEPRQLAACVLAEAVILGAIGTIAGIALGLAAAFATGPWLDQLTDRRNPPMAVIPGALLVAGAIGLLAALIAAAIPAWTAARMPILSALSGRRPPTAPARRTLRLGIATVVVAFAITLIGAGWGFTGINTSLLLLGAVLGVLGFGACSPWFLERLEGLATRLPLSPRLALRDTARSRSRNGPIVTALLASFAATVAVAALLASQDAQASERYLPSLRSDQLLIAGPGATTAGPRAARELEAIGFGPLVPTYDVNGDGEYLNASEWNSGGNLVIGDENLLRAIGAETALGDFRTGAAIILADEQKDYGTATVHRVSDDGETGTLPTRTVVEAALYASLPGALVSTQTAASLGLHTGIPNFYLLRLPHAVTPQDITRAGELAAASPDTAVNWEPGLQHPGELFRVLLVIGSLIFALSVTGVAVALGEAEARPDQRTLLALGADPGVRRRITAARAGVIAAIAGVLAVPAGLLPVWGVLVSHHDQLVVPLPEVLVALLVLPLSAVVGAALLSRPVPMWSTYRSEGS